MMDIEVLNGIGIKLSDVSRLIKTAVMYFTSTVSEDIKTLFKPS